MEINPTMVQTVALIKNGQEQGVEIPPNAYVSNIKISIQRIADVSILSTSVGDINKTRVSDVLKFEPSGSVFQSPVVIFLVADRLPSNGKRLAIFKLDDLTQKWQEQPNSTTDLATKKVRVQTLSFSYWTVMEVPKIDVIKATSPPEKESTGTPRVMAVSMFSGLAGLLVFLWTAC